jgi:DNA-binding GntR family transcriptional regulator
MEHLALHATEVLARYRTGETEELARRFDTSGRTVRKFLLRLEDRDAA